MTPVTGDGGTGDGGTDDGVAAAERVMPCSPTAVWDVLADGWAYSGFVVGAVRIREVDPSWPAPDTRIHHSVGAWPLLIDDTSSVVACDPGRELVLRVRVWPAGEAQVRFVLEPVDAGTRVQVFERAEAGPGLLGRLPPLRTLLAARNRELLQRLELRALGRERARAGAD